MLPFACCSGLHLVWFFVAVVTLSSLPMFVALIEDVCVALPCVIFSHLTKV